MTLSLYWYDRRIQVPFSASFITRLEQPWLQWLHDDDADLYSYLWITRRNTQRNIQQQQWLNLLSKIHRNTLNKWVISSCCWDSESFLFAEMLSCLTLSPKTREPWRNDTYKTPHFGEIITSALAEIRSNVCRSPHFLLSLAFCQVANKAHFGHDRRSTFTRHPDDPTEPREERPRRRHSLNQWFSNGPISADARRSRRPCNGIETKRNLMNCHIP